MGGVLIGALAGACAVLLFRYTEGKKENKKKKKKNAFGDEKDREDGGNGNGKNPVRIEYNGKKK